MVIAGNEDFFVLTKRIHNFLHGSSGGGGELDNDARRVFDEVTERNAAEFRELIKPEDVVRSAAHGDIQAALVLARDSAIGEHPRGEKVCVDSLSLHSDRVRASRRSSSSPERAEAGGPAWHG